MAGNTPKMLRQTSVHLPMIHLNNDESDERQSLLSGSEDGTTTTEATIATTDTIATTEAARIATATATTATAVAAVTSSTATLTTAAPTTTATVTSQSAAAATAAVPVTTAVVTVAPTSTTAATTSAVTSTSATTSAAAVVVTSPQTVAATLVSTATAGSTATTTATVVPTPNQYGEPKELPSLLYQYCATGQTECVKDILEDPFTEIKGDKERYPFLVASKRGYYEIVEAFLEKFEENLKLLEGLQINDMWGNTVFHILIKSITKNISNVNKERKDKISYEKCLKIVMNYTEKIKGKQIIQNKDFHLICDATMAGLLDVTKLLLEDGCDPTNSEYQRLGKYAIHHASFNGFHKILQLLVDKIGNKGENIQNPADKLGNTAIHNVVLGRKKMVQCQREILSNQDHKKCLDILLTKEILLKKDNTISKLFEIDAVNLYGNTALHLAVTIHNDSDHRLDKLLIEKEAKTDIKNCIGKEVNIPGTDNKRKNLGVKEIFLKYIKDGNFQEVEKLLKNNANHLNDYLVNETPLSTSFEKGYYKIARCLVNQIIDNDIKIKKELPANLLHEVIRCSIEFKGDPLDMIDYNKCLNILLTNKEHLNIELDFRGLSSLLLQNGEDPSQQAPGTDSTPLSIAFSKGYYKIAGMLMEVVSKPNKTKEMFQNLFKIVIEGEIKLSKVKRSKKDRQKYFYKFINYSECFDILLKDNGISGVTDDMLYKIYDNNLTSLVLVLLHHNSDPAYVFKNVTNKDKCEKNPILLATRHGNYKILESLIENSENRKKLECLKEANEWGNTALINAVRSYTVNKPGNDSRRNDDVDYYKCVENLLRHKSHFNIDAKDKSGNTALHHSLQIQNDNSFTKILIKNGALIDVENDKGHSPMSSIRCSLLESVLDDCIEGNDKEDNVMTMDLSALSHNQSLDIKTETDLVKAIYFKDNYKKLMLHPIITTFLSIKWEKLELFWKLNLLISMIFSVSIMSYVILFVDNSDDYSIWETILKFFISIIGIFALIRKFTKLIILKLKYFVSFDNWLDPFILVMAGLTLYYPDYKYQETFSAWLVVSIVVKFILLIGKAPNIKMTMYIRMFKTVMWNFLKVSIFLYVWLILSFSFAFLILSKGSISQPDLPSPLTNSSTLMTYLKFIMGAIVVSTGELEYSDMVKNDKDDLLSFDVSPVSSRLFFFLFVIVVAIVIMNLINGIAISDISEIRTEAECYGIGEEVEYIIVIDELLGLINKLEKYSVFGSCYPNKKLIFYPSRKYEKVWSLCEGHVCSKVDFGKCGKFIKTNFIKAVILLLPARIKVLLPTRIKLRLPTWIKRLLPDEGGVEKCDTCKLYYCSYYSKKHKCNKRFDCELCCIINYTTDDSGIMVHQCLHKHKYPISHMRIENAMNILQNKQDENKQQESLSKINNEMEKMQKAMSTLQNKQKE